MQGKLSSAPLLRNGMFRWKKGCVAAACIALASLTGARPPAAQAADSGPALTVDVKADRHPIHPEIYGVNAVGTDAAFQAFMKEARIPVNRWGGDATTRYNWQADASNAGDDWFFMAGGEQTTAVPGASADKFVAENRASGAKSLLTIPIIGYINKAVHWDCSFPVSLFGPQQKVNPYVHPIIDGQQTDAGNGRKPDGTAITLTRDQILRVHVPNSPAFQKGWVQHLLGKFGPAAQGGVAIYQMDNEPSGWGNTHRDIHPDATGYDELIGKTQAYAAMIKAADPTAAIDGPGDFGWAVYLGGGKPGDDAKSHGGVGFAEYYLQQMRAYEKQHGTRLLDYFDEHYYPVSDDGVGALANAGAGDAATQALRLQSTRSLWDPTYVEKDWIGKYYGAIRLIPRFHEWVDKNYSGTKLAITEYNFGGLESINGALAQADALGIFGRERLDLATLWGPPKPNEPGAYAFRIYRNYDGQGGQYGETWVRSASADQGQLAIYGAERKQDGALTLIMINKTGHDLNSRLALSGFSPARNARVFRYSAANLNAIVPEPDLAVTADGFTAAYPANSITLVVLSPQ